MALPENMLGLWPLGQQLIRRGCPDECALAGLSYAKVAGIQNTKANLQTINMQQIGCQNVLC